MAKHGPISDLSDAAATLALLKTPGIGVSAVRRALHAAQALCVPVGELVTLPADELIRRVPGDGGALSGQLANVHIDMLEQAQGLWERAAHGGVTALLATDADFPRLLTDGLGADAPAIVFILGDLSLLEDTAWAIVGARNASARGRQLAEDCAAAAVESEATVVSGGAAGVDSIAHACAIVGGGKTVVVLPQGLLTYKMPAELAAAVERGDAAVLSEFPLDNGWETYAAVRRNATISALSEIVCVIEPKKDGGSIRTARCALDQGKGVFVYCDPTHESVMRTLLRAGAASLLDAEGRFSSVRLRGIAHDARGRTCDQTTLCC